MTKQVPQQLWPGIVLLGFLGGMIVGTILGIWLGALGAGA